MREAKAKDAVTLGIVNVISSTIAKEADYTIYTYAGPEIAVATTKLFSTAGALYILAVRFAVKSGNCQKTREKLVKEIEALPAKAAEISI